MNLSCYKSRDIDRSPVQHQRYGGGQGVLDLYDRLSTRCPPPSVFPPSPRYPAQLRATPGGNLAKSLFAYSPLDVDTGRRGGNDDLIASCRTSVPHRVGGTNTMTSTMTSTTTFSAALRKPRRRRTAFTLAQLQCLERRFRCQKYVSVNNRSTVANRLRLSETQVKTWYQNRR